MKFRHERGLTLLEAIMVVTLIALGSAIMLPNLSRLLDQAQAESQRELLTAHLHQARARAVNEAKMIEVCGSSDGTSCDGRWQLGWLTREYVSGTPSSYYSSNHSGVTWKGFSSTIIYFANGTTPSSNGRFDICSPRGSLQWRLVLNRQGRLRSEKVTQNTLAAPC